MDCTGEIEGEADTDTAGEAPGVRRACLRCRNASILFNTLLLMLRTGVPNCLPSTELCADEPSSKNYHEIFLKIMKFVWAPKTKFENKSVESSLIMRVLLLVLLALCAVARAQTVLDLTDATLADAINGNEKIMVEVLQAFHGKVDDMFFASQIECSDVVCSSLPRGGSWHRFHSF
jgi:hypothetical protein